MGGDSSKLEHHVSQHEDGGGNPTSPLQIRPRELVISVCSAREIREFVETHHYSHSINGVKVTVCFKVEHDRQLVGAAMFGAMSTTAWKKFADSECKVLELRRLVLLDKVGRNAESRVIGWCLRYIARILPHISVIVSYADPYYNHSGTIYKASNFKYVGVSGKDRGYLDQETNKTYHSRALRTKYKSDYKPFVKRLREKLRDGKLVPVDLPGKHCFVYYFSSKSKND